MATQITVKATVRVPKVPNFLCMGEGDAAPVIDVADVTDEGLRQVAARWADDLIENARQRRVRPAAPDA